jgi:hypothetical protein
MSFVPDPGVTDSECLNFEERLEDRYNQPDMQPRPLRTTYVDPVGYARWTSSYWFKRQSGMPHEEATQAVLTEIQNIIHPPLFPPVPTRDQVCGVSLSFQGLTVTTNQFGTLPWFEPALCALSDPADRQRVYEAKKSAGDTHCIIEFDEGGFLYNEPGQPYQNVQVPNYESNPASFLSLVEEIILAGLTPIVVFNGDNGDAMADGYPNALRQLPILVNLLASSKFADLNQYVLYGRLWDGVFYGSSPANIQAFGTAFRQLLPNGYLAIEFNVGHIPTGGGPSDYAPNGSMVGYDVIMAEFNNGLPRTSDPDPNTNPGASIWTIVDRMVTPFIRPTDMPTGAKWDPDGAPFYLATPSPRGKYYFVAFEFDTYRWVRSQVSASDVSNERAYLKSMGCTFTG